MLYVETRPISPTNAKSNSTINVFMATLFSKRPCMATFTSYSTRSIQETTPPLARSILCHQVSIRLYLPDTNCKGSRKRHIVHFDRLKPCHPDTRIELDQLPLPTGTPPDNTTTREHHAGDELNVIDAPVVPPTASRYPTRHRRAPDWLIPHITH